MRQRRAAWISDSALARCALLHACVCAASLALVARPGTHPGYLRALDALDLQQNEHVLAVKRLREERLHNVEEMYVAEMQAIDDEYKVRRG